MTAFLCPLCGGARSRTSAFGRVQYEGATYEYRDCDACGSAICCPMPDALALRRMYGPSYLAQFAAHPVDDSPRDEDWVVNVVRRERPQLFVDYGCGSGSVLVKVGASAGQRVGIEYDEAVTRNLALRTGLDVLTPSAAFQRLRGRADVLHVGDVLEHMTDLPGEMDKLVDLVRPGGLFIAQGPLEANTHLFLWALKVSRRLRGALDTLAAPYHVILATASGQRILFERAGLTTESFRVTEVAWPAPARLEAAHTKRDLALYFARRCSVALSGIARRQWGNRYYFVGRRPAE